MRFCALIVLLFTTALARYISVSDELDTTESIVSLLSASNHHGAPSPPGSFGSRAGWYYGDDPSSSSVDGLPWLGDKVYQIYACNTFFLIRVYHRIYVLCSSKGLMLFTAPSPNRNLPKPMADDQLPFLTPPLLLHRLLHRHMSLCLAVSMHLSMALVT